ncbi:hypothetical protein DFH27DRAFT_553509 [Peziza echinospora]|nr:hypothetical protein DFH27DRAFT_553509 [Peziza echinospora]
MTTKATQPHTTSSVDFGYTGINPGNWTTMLTPIANEPVTPAITQIELAADERGFIIGFQCKYNAPGRSSLGLTIPSSPHQKWSFDLDPDEWINKIEGGYLPTSLTYVKFYSTKNKSYGPYGGAVTADTKTFVLQPSQEGQVLLWIGGKTVSGFSLSLEAEWTSPSSSGITQPSILKYATGSNPGFLGTVTSQSAILIVGTPPKPIIVGSPPKPSSLISQAIIDQLPYLPSASSQGENPTPMVTVLPKANPEVMAAFIEYIKTGSYTYYRGSNTTAGTAMVSQVDVKEALFHLELCATAIQSACYGEMVSKLLEVVQYALGRLNAIDSLTVWKAGYGYDVNLTLEMMEKLAGVKGLMAKMRDLGTSHAQQLDLMVPVCPQLACDMLLLFKNV